ncbi:MAG: holo-ACP synthase [Planctomycetia bacterium]|nr:holo-ACP synthase [Planctomycetia bacterium]
MKIIGIGTDITSCSRIERILARHPDAFIDHVYTEEEHRYCSRHSGSVEHYAGRWCAKEAVLKALGTGWIRGITWRDVEVRHELSGRPTIRLSGGAKEKADSLGIDEVLITISHCREYATATAIAIRHISGDSR